MKYFIKILSVFLSYDYMNKIIKVIDLVKKNLKIFKLIARINYFKFNCVVLSEINVDRVSVNSF